MFEYLKKTFKKIKDDPPGKRFVRQYKRRHEQRSSTFTKVGLMALGLVIALGGIFMLPAPGPGMVVIMIGLALIAQESLWMSKLLDKTEVYLRKWVDRGQKVWQNSSAALKVIIISGSLILILVALYLAYLIFLA